MACPWGGGVVPVEWCRGGIVGRRRVVRGSRARSLAFSRQSLPGTTRLQRVDVGDDIGDGFLVGKCADDGTHLRAVGVAGVGAAQAFLKVAELRREIPVGA